MSFERFGNALADEIGDGSRHGDLRRQKAAFVAQVTQERTFPWVPMIAAASLACAALVAGFWLWRTEEATFEINGVVGHAGQEVTAHADEVPIIFADGSTVRLLAHSSLRVEKVAVGRVLVRLSDGGLSASVRHRTPVKWDFVANGFDVRVVGTHLAIAATDGIEVAVTEGEVRVSGQGLPQGGVAVATGMKLSASAEGRYVVKEMDEAAAMPSANETHVEEPRDAANHEARAADGRHATPEVRKPHPSEPVPSADALVAKADAARVAGDGATARKLLTTLREHYPHSREAARAQFMLGRIALELDHDPAAAAKAFAGYISASPHGELIEEAYGRELEALRAAHDLAAARDVARDYLSRYPEGDYTTLARSLSGQ